MEALNQLISQCVALPSVNIDTDQIIPARFLTTTSFKNLGQHAFADWRYDSKGQENPESPLNFSSAQYRQILVAGKNFGCGSSREHAPRALVDFGFRVVISERIADIFKNNAAHCGLLPIELSEADCNWLLSNPDEQVLIHLGEQYVEFAQGHRSAFSIDPFARHCLMCGQDPLDFIRSHQRDIEAFEQDHSISLTTAIDSAGALA